MVSSLAFNAPSHIRGRSFVAAVNYENLSGSAPMKRAGASRTVTLVLGKSPFKALIVGSGPAALEAALTLYELAHEVEVHLLAPEPDFVNRPLSVVEPFGRPGVRRYPLSRLSDLGVRVLQGRLEAVDVQAHVATTSAGEELSYDALLVAIGATAMREAAPALSFGGLGEADMMHALVGQIDTGEIESVVFRAPAGCAWTLPIYELALQTAERARDVAAQEVTVTVASCEKRPLELFGEAAACVVETLFAERGIQFVGAEDLPTADRLISLPLLAGRRVAGLPADDEGFLPVDLRGRVAGTDRVWAAGDGADFPIKQAGLATQQADAAARSIASAAGYEVEETGYEPVLRAILIAGRDSWYLRRRLDGRDLGQTSKRALWWPPTKIAGLRLAPFLDKLDTERRGPHLEREIEGAGRAVRRLIIGPDGTKIRHPDPEGR